MTCTHWVGKPSILFVRLAVFVALIASGNAFAGEYAVLSSGFRLHADGHSVEGNVVKLQNAAGIIELPADTVVRFELDDYVAPVTPEAPIKAADIQTVQQPTPQELVSQAAARAGLPPELVRSLVKAESAFQPRAVSPKGAIGLMQLMPETAKAHSADPWDPKQNVEAGVAYLRELLVKYQDDPHQVTKALAAYNAGPGAVDKYNGVPPYRETIDYVMRVVRDYQNSQK